MNRRAFLSGLIAAPAVIRVAPLMRIAPVPLYGAGPIMFAFDTRQRWSIAVTAEAVRKYASLVSFPADCLYAELPSPPV